MAAPTAETLGADFVLQVGGTNVAGQTGGSLVLERTLLDVTNVADNKWRNVTALQRSWRIPYTGIYVQGTSDLVGCPSLKIADSGGSVASIEQLKSATISISTELVPLANCDSGDDRESLPRMRSATITFSADYQDFANSNDQETLVEDWEAAAPEVDFQFDFQTGGTGGTSYPMMTGAGIVTNIQINGDQASTAVLTGTIEVTGAITFDDGTTATQAALLALISAVIPSTPTNDPSTVAVKFAYDLDHDGTIETGSTRFSGNAYVTQLDITFTHNELSAVNAELFGNGALTRATS